MRERVLLLFLSCHQTICKALASVQLSSLTLYGKQNKNMNMEVEVEEGDKNLRETNFLMMIFSLDHLSKVQKLLEINFGYDLLNLITRYLNQTVPIEDGIRHAGCAQLVLMIIS